MAFNSNSGKQNFSATAAQTDFDFNFKIYEDTDVKVYLTPVGNEPDDAADILTLASEYTVSVDGDAGGTVTLLSGATLNDTIVVKRELPVTRTTSYVTQGDLRAETINIDQNYQTYLIIDTVVDLAAVLKLSDTDVGISTLLPAVVADAYLKWNAAGDAIENDTTIPDAVISAADSVLEANSWANEAEDVPVKEYTAGVPSDRSPTVYSALHYEAKSELQKWDAQAKALTSLSYAVEAEDTPVNVVTSDGDGTFTYTPQAGVFSSLHHAAKAATWNPANYYTKTEIDAKPTFKNLFTNGTLLSWQEGVPTGITTTGTWFADVFTTISDSGATLDVSQQKTSDNAESARITASVASTDLTGTNRVSGFNSKQFELQDFAHLKDEDVTLQFKFKASETGFYPIALRDATNAESYVTTFNYTVADTEQLVTFTFNLDSTRLDFTVADNAMLFRLLVGCDNNATYELADGSKDSWQTGNYQTTDACENWSTTLNAYIQIGDIQIEEGTVATAVERPSMPINDNRCQRYVCQCELDNDANAKYYASAGGVNYSVGDYSAITTMRASPSCSIITAPTYTNCSTFVFAPSIRGFTGLVSAAGVGIYRATGGVYLADARL